MGDVHSRTGKEESEQARGCEAKKDRESAFKERQKRSLTGRATLGCFA
jgi:hypothetical protein